MPEGDLVRKLANQWDEWAGEALLLTSPQHRFATEAAKLNNTVFQGAHTHGKHLFLEFQNELYVHIHLGLYGRFVFQSVSTKPRDTVRLRATLGSQAIDLSGPTQCETLDAEGKAKIHARLGPDPLRQGDSIESLLPWLKESKWPVGKTLLEQSKIAGLGNIYRAEILFMFGLNPHTANSAVRESEWKSIWRLSQDLLEASVARGGSIKTTGKDSPLPLTVSKRPSQTRAYVYKRTGAPCYGCGTPILQEEQASRTLYWCPSCQA